MKVLITGGAGLVGSHLSDRLTEEGHEITVIDDLSNGKRENLANANVKLIVDDVSTCKIEGDFDVIYNLACFPRSMSFDDPMKDVDVNVKGMVNVLEYAKKHDSLVIFSSNSGIYDSSKMPVDELTPDHPTSPYDVDKLTAEHFCKIYNELYGVKYVIFRFAAIYGPRQAFSEDWQPVVVTFLNNVIAGRVSDVHGDGEQTRDLIYVEDIVDALVLAKEKEAAIRKTMTLGTGIETSINKLLVTCSSALQRPTDGRHTKAKDGDIKRMCYPSKLALKVLGWKAKTSLEEGVRKTKEWLIEPSNIDKTMRLEGYEKRE